MLFGWEDLCLLEIKDLVMYIIHVSNTFKKDLRFADTTLFFQEIIDVIKNCSLRFSKNIEYIKFINNSNL